MATLLGTLLVDLDRIIPLAIGLISILGALWHISSMFHLASERINLLHLQLNNYIDADRKAFAEYKEEIRDDFDQVLSAIKHNREAVETRQKEINAAVHQTLQDLETRIRELEKRLYGSNR